MRPSPRRRLPNSSNSNRLSELAQREGVASYLIDSAAEIDPAWVIDKHHIGVTAGASALKSWLTAS